MCASTGGAGGSFSTPTGRPRSTGPTAKSSTATHHRPPAQTDPGAGITAIGCDSCAQCGPNAATSRPIAIVLASGGLEYGVEVPPQEIRIRSVGSPRRQRDDLPGLGVERVAVAELAAQPRADPQPVGRVDADVTVVEH